MTRSWSERAAPFAAAVWLAGCASSVASLVERERFPDACELRERGAPDPQQALDAAVADRTGVSLEVTPITVAELTERVGVAPELAGLEIFRVRVTVSRLPPGAAFFVSGSPALRADDTEVLLPPGGAGSRLPSAIRFEIPDPELEEVPPPHRSEVYTPTPLPPLRRVRPRYRGVLEGMLSELVDGLRGLDESRLTPESRRELEAWRADNEARRREHDAGQAAAHRAQQDRIIAARARNAIARDRARAQRRHVRGRVSDLEVELRPRCERAGHLRADEDGLWLPEGASCQWLAAVEPPSAVTHAELHGRVRFSGGFCDVPHRVLSASPSNPSPAPR